jgi:hypothetical protein
MHFIPSMNEKNNHKFILAWFKLSLKNSLLA